MVYPKESHHVMVESIPSMSVFFRAEHWSCVREKNMK